MNFGITPGQIDSIASTWATEGKTLTGLRFPTTGAAGDCATLAALAQCSAAGHRSTKRLGTDLGALARALKLFNALTAESDVAAANDIVAGEQR
ncbi:MAG: hypothetical protein QM658_17400 [Gordonia sp. (in: high G+C Gram-positive bacteria)]